MHLRDSESLRDAEVARRVLATARERLDGPPATLRRWSVTAVLGDTASRTVIEALAARDGVLAPAGVAAIAEHPGLTPRVVRDRLRELQRSGLVAHPHEGWTLTPAGQSLHRLLALITRIAARGAGLEEPAPQVLRDAATERVLRALNDPVILQLCGCLAGPDPLSPTALEERCAPTPRRTLYRRLGEMVDTGVIVRHTSGGVPRATTYELSGRWRHAAVLCMLPAWWEGRHRPAETRAGAIDLEVPVRAVLPVVDAGRLREGCRARWVFATDAVPLDLAVARGRLVAAASDGPADVTVTGTPSAWALALVGDQREGLHADGDGVVGRAVFEAVRAALLAYVR